MIETCISEGFDVFPHMKFEYDGEYHGVVYDPGDKIFSVGKWSDQGIYGGVKYVPGSEDRIPYVQYTLLFAHILGMKMGGVTINYET